MPITSNYRLIIINGPSDKWELSGFKQKVMFDRSWKLKLLSAHSEFLIYGSAYVAEQNMRLWKKLKGTRFFLGRFESLKKV